MVNFWSYAVALKLKEHVDFITSYFSSVVVKTHGGRNDVDIFYVKMILLKSMYERVVTSFLHIC